MLSLLILWSLTAGSAVIGWRTATINKSVGVMLAGICCALLILGALFARNMDWMPDALICSPVVLFEFAWFTPPAAFLFAFGARQAEQRGKRSTLMKAFLILLCAFSTLHLADQNGWLLGQIGSAPARIDSNGVVRQNSGSTCGAAACATLLRHLKIDSEAVESKMIPLCHTGMFGSTPLGMAAGLKSVAEPHGWNVRIVKCDAQTFFRQRQPAVVSLREGFSASHAVAVLEFNDSSVMIADPLSGLSPWTIADFKRLFFGEAIIVMPNTASSKP
jgi:predicted double-glycine peptidase